MPWPTIRRIPSRHRRPRTMPTRRNSRSRRAIRGTRRRPSSAGRGRPTGDRLVFKMRIAPHWFDGDDRFWYRNDGPGGARSSSWSTPCAGPDSPHSITRGWRPRSPRRPGKTYKADRLPFEEIELIDGAKAVRFRVGEVTWKCPLDSYECSKVEADAAGIVDRLARLRRPGTPRRAGPAPRSARELGFTRTRANASARPTASGRRSSRITTSSSVPRGRPRTSA